MRDEETKRARVLKQLYTRAGKNLPRGINCSCNAEAMILHFYFANHSPCVPILGPKHETTNTKLEKEAPPYTKHEVRHTITHKTRTYHSGPGPKCRDRFGIGIKTNRPLYLRPERYVTTHARNPNRTCETSLPAMFVSGKGFRVGATPLKACSSKQKARQK